MQAATPSFITVLILMSLFLPPTSRAATEAGDYHLQLSFQPGQDSGKLMGTATLTILPHHKLTLTFPAMQITSATLHEAGGGEGELPEIGNALILPAATTPRTLRLSYMKTVIRGEDDNLISPDGISLTSNWHPLPDQPMNFSLTGLLPDTFTAICESETFPLAVSGKTINAVYKRPTTTIHFTAGPYSIHKRQVRENLFVYALFFAEDAALAEGYLQAASTYLKRYEEEIGPFPYNHYVIVANRLPTGYGMPTFTLLGQRVLRLPFIKDTSLGHEILHSWFGNSVEVAPGGGNWCEGLTAFLADHAYREEKGEGVADRKESIIRYLSYVRGKTATPLEAFGSASHNQAMAEAKRAVGYDRGALFFHELRERIGRPAFSQGLRRFYSSSKGQKVGWLELRQSFTSAANIDLEDFFNERLQRSDIPDLLVENIKVTAVENRSALSFTLRQKTAQPYSLMLPIRIRTLGGEIQLTQEIRDTSTQLTIYLHQRPLQVTIDPNHDFLRQLAPEEIPPVWSQFLGAENKLAILGEESDREQFQPLLDSLSSQGLTLTTADTITDQEQRDNNLLFLGTDQGPARALFGPPPPAKAGLILDVRKNPLAPEKVAVLVTGNDRQTTRGVIGRLGHYGKYSYLEFNKGSNSEKRIEPAHCGLDFVLEELPKGGATPSLADFHEIIERLNTMRVVYVGETHTSFTDHLLQLRIIEALYTKNHSLSIGMEMFPTSAQPVLDRYILGDKSMSEREFLKESGYYKVWRYDYRLLRDIVNFAREKKIPIIALNLEQTIVSEVFRSGGTDSLSSEIKASLPRDRDLDMHGYSERLRQVHAQHLQGNHGRGLSSGFLQAQALWDESMARTIAEYCGAHPQQRMVVLAGNQHTRKDSGIPPRVQRRLPLAQASVINLYDSKQTGDIGEVADYYFLASPQELPEIPKIGVVLASDTREGRAVIKISELSPQGKAAAAGLGVGDILEKINDNSITDMADLHIAMLDTKKGDTIMVKIRRPVDGGEQVLDIPVELTPPSAPLP